MDAGRSRSWRRARSRSAMMAVAVEGLVGDQPPKATPSMSGATPTVSKRWPGSRTKRTRLPSASVRARILVVMPPLERAYGLASESPFCALSVAMDLDDGGIDHGVLHIRLISSSLEKPYENIGLHPVAVALEDACSSCRRMAEDRARGSCSRDPQHRFDKAPVITAAAARVRRLAQTMRLHLRPLGVGQYKSFHPKLKSQLAIGGNPNSTALEGSGYGRT